MTTDSLLLPGREKSDSLLLSEREEYVLLVLMNGERYGNEIMDAIEDVSNDLIPIGCSVYPLLRKLKKRGYVQSRTEKERLNVRKGNRREYYSLTKKGMEALEHRQKFRDALQNWKPDLAAKNFSF